MSNQSINTVNIPSLQNKKHITFNGVTPQPIATTTPAMQGATSDTFKQSVDNNYISNRVKASQSEEQENPALTLGLTAGTWYALSQLMDKFNPMCAGSFKPEAGKPFKAKDFYDKSILGKLGAWGDNFATKNPIGKAINNFIRRTNIQLHKWSKNSKFLYSLRNHSTSPEWTFAKVPGKGLHGFLAQDTQQIFEEFLKPIANRTSAVAGIPTGHKNIFQALEQYGMKQADIDAFAAKMKGKPYRAKALALQQKELSLLGADSKVVKRIYKNKGFAGLQQYAEHLKLKALGFKSKAEFEALKGKFMDNPDKVMKHLKHIVEKHPEFKVSVWRGTGFFGKLKSHFLGRTAGFTEYYNKYLATLGKGNKTGLGRFLPKALGWLAEGGTNRFAGGKIAVLMQAFIFADMLKHTIKAPKGEKGKTLAERLVNDFSYFLAMPAGIWATHKIGGFKYAGLDAKGKKEYLKALETFNKRNAAGKYADKATYKRALEQLNQKLGTKNIKNPITKLFNKIGRFINMGNERVSSYKSPSKFNLNFLRKFANGNILGVPMRILIPIMMVSPFIAKLATKGAHAIFGRPTKSVLDEETPEETKSQDAATAQTNPENPQQPNQTKPVDAAEKPQHKNPNDYQDTNLIKQTINGEYKPQQPAEKELPPENDPETGEPLRTYIPSTDPVIIQDPDMTAAEEVLANSNKAEEFIINTLNGSRKY